MHSITASAPLTRRETTARTLRAWRAAAWISAIVAFATLVLMSSSAQAGTLNFANNTPVANADTAAPGVTSTIVIPATATVPNMFAMHDVNVTVSIGDNGGVSAFTGDLQVTLQHPGGTTVTLKPGITGAGGGNNAVNVVWTFDDQAATQIATTSAGGTFQPTGSLASFNALTPAGTWTLRVIDVSNFPGEGNILNSWSLTIQAVPEPSTGATMALGLLGLGALVSHRRRRRLARAPR